MGPEVGHDPAEVLVIPDGLLVHTVTRIRPATSTDAYGNTAKDYVTGAATASVRCRLQQDQRAEQFVGRDATEQLWTMFTNELDIRFDDRIRWDDHPAGAMTFDVAGPPEPVADGAGHHHREVSLRGQAG